MTSPENCEWADKHLPIVVYSGWIRFRRRWWIRCWECDLKLGPFKERLSATAVCAYIDQYGTKILGKGISWMEDVTPIHSVDGLVGHVYGPVEGTVQGYTTPPN